MKQRGNIYVGIVLALGVSLVLTGGAWMAYKRGEKSGKSEVQASWDADKTKRAEAAAKAAEDARLKEQELQTAANKQRSVANAKIKSLDLALAESNQRLRERPERPSGDLPTAAGTGPDAPSCTGARLFRGDAEFLSGFAADADRLRIALAACQTAYEGARAVK